MKFGVKVAGWRFGVSLLLLSALGGLALWQSLGHGSESSRAESEKRNPSSKSLAVVQRADNRQLAIFAQLKTSPEGLPSDLKRVLRRPPSGANWELAQRLPVRAQGRFWAIPASGSICMIGQGKDRIIEMTCATTKAALQHGVAIVRLGQAKVVDEPAARLTVGMAPDGSRTVVIHTGAMMTTGAVANGVFAVRDMATDPPDELTFR